MPKYIDLLRSHHDQADFTRTPTSDDLEDMLADEPVTVEKTGKAPGSTEETALPSEDISANTAEAAKWLQQCVRLMLAVFQSAAKESPCRVDDLSAHVQMLAHSLIKNPDSLNALELELANRSHDIRDVDSDLGDLVEKAIMLMLYAVKVGLQMGMSEDELHTLTLAGMLHHIGMAQVPVETRHKKNALNEGEYEQIRQAPKRGEEYLRACGIADTRILTAAAQAQERYDGSGPMGMSERAISPTARIIGLLSVFEALIHYRPYRKRLLPRDAIRELVSKHKPEFDPITLKMLIESISLYPVGTYVQLNSGDIGQVILVHPRLPLRPMVRLNMNRHGNGIKPRVVDLRGQPNLMVSRCMYEEELAEIKLQPAAN